MIPDALEDEIKQGLRRLRELAQDSAKRCKAHRNTADERYYEGRVSAFALILRDLENLQTPADPSKPLGPSTPLGRQCSTCIHARPGKGKDALLECHLQPPQVVFHADFGVSSFWPQVPRGGVCAFHGVPNPLDFKP